MTSLCVAIRELSLEMEHRMLLLQSLGLHAEEKFYRWPHELGLGPNAKRSTQSCFQFSFPLHKDRLFR
jgi:hypothetical protein